MSDVDDRQGGGMDGPRQLGCSFSPLVEKKKKKSNLYFLVVVSGLGPRFLGRGV